MRVCVAFLLGKSLINIGLTNHSRGNGEVSCVYLETNSKTAVKNYTIVYK